MSNFLAPRVEQMLILELELELNINISLIGAVHGARSAPEIPRELPLSNAKAIQIKYGAPSTPGQLPGVGVMFPAPALANMLKNIWN